MPESRSRTAAPTVATKELEDRSVLKPPVQTELEDGRPQAGIEMRRFLLLALQLGLLVMVAFLYRLELDRGFGSVAVLIFAGFLVHSWLPLRARVPFFVFLTFVAMAILLRMQSLWLVALGLGLMGLCHVPISWSARVGLVALAAAVLAVMQAGWIAAPWEGVVLPILAALFMFRLVIYLYDLKTAATPTTPWKRIAYFFMLPNICFPLFPVVDFKTFLRTYYDAPAAEIYQKGLYWMMRGMSHLVLYRLVYHLLPRADSELGGAFGFYVFAAMTWALYLRVSGLFHLIVGSLCLFGFNLPPTNHNYFLASGFNDLWRRANIYFKDFMMMVGFNPVFVATRRWSLTVRLVLATSVVILITWFLHSYQWFWLTGSFPVRWVDVGFWGLLGVALAINSVRESRRGRRRLAGAGWSWRQGMGVTLRTIGVFTVMAFLWSLWYSESVKDWGYHLLRVRDSSPLEWALLGGLLAGLVLFGLAADWLKSRGWGFTRLQESVWRRAPVVVPSLALAMLVLGFPRIHHGLGEPVQVVMEKAQSTEPNAFDRERQERGYYETLSRATQLGPPPRTKPPVGDDLVAFRDSPVVRETPDLRGYEVKPGMEVVYRGVLFQTNSWGLRDREYEKAKPQQTYRIAMVGSSQEMGIGVENEQTFENIVEDRLNRELVGRGYERFEILNFGVAGYGLLQTLHVTEKSVPRFEPDLVINVLHPGETGRLVDRLHLTIGLSGEEGLEYDYLKQVLRKTRTGAHLPKREFDYRLRNHEDDILRWAITRKIEVVRDYGAIPVFLLLPSIDSPFRRNELVRLTALVREAGGIAIYLPNVFTGYDPKDLRIEEWDNHPNVRGHQLIADHVYEGLLAHADTLGLIADRAVESTVLP